MGFPAFGVALLAKRLKRTARLGRALAALGTSPTKVLWLISPIDRNGIFFCKPHINATSLRTSFPADGPSMPDPTVFVATWRAASRLKERIAALSITARCVATIFERWNFLIKPSLPLEKEDHNRLTPPGPFAAVSLLEYGGLNPILSSLGGRSDAARRVVIQMPAAS